MSRQPKLERFGRTEREKALWGALNQLLVTVVASPTRVSGDPSVATAIDAAIFTRQRLRLEPLDGLTTPEVYDRLIAFWTAERDRVNSSIAKPEHA
jgi:hypothetical protein